MLCQIVVPGLTPIPKILISNFILGDCNFKILIIISYHIISLRFFENENFAALETRAAKFSDFCWN